jgi:lipopolysaccharide/colanic/teichoic acid biosynthesis glycosyltransferase
VVSFEREALLKAGAAGKRLLDLLFAGVLLVLWAPALAIGALVNGLRGRRPLSTTRRAGRELTEFDMIRLNPAERPSALRRFVERHGLSRFPAIANVWRGEMSFVGPAPVTPERARELDRRQELRFDARPGITGLAQVSLGDASLADGDPEALDVYYVQNWSLGGDLKILLRWFARCIAGRCAE